MAHIHLRYCLASSNLPNLLIYSFLFIPWTNLSLNCQQKGRSSAFFVTVLEKKSIQHKFHLHKIIVFQKRLYQLLQLTQLQYKRERRLVLVPSWRHPIKPWSFSVHEQLFMELYCVLGQGNGHNDTSKVSHHNPSNVFQVKMADGWLNGSAGDAAQDFVYVWHCYLSNLAS